MHATRFGCKPGGPRSGRQRARGDRQDAVLQARDPLEEAGYDRRIGRTGVDGALGLSSYWSAIR